MSKSVKDKISRVTSVVLGVVFIVSGLMKAVDPVGTSLIVGSYFWMFRFWFLGPLALAVGEIVSICEALLGVILVVGCWRKLAAIFSAIVLGGFTILSVIVLILNPAMDCGCFGQFIHLTHLQSLIKNLVLDALWCVVFIPFPKTIKISRRQKVTLYAMALAVLGISVFYMFHNPPVDLTDYAVGTAITSDNVPSIHDSNNNYLTTEDFRGEKAIITVWNPDRLPRATMSLVRKLSYRPEYIVVTVQGRPLPINNNYFGDMRAMMSINRSNGGVTYIRDGVIVGKAERSKLAK